MACGVAPLRNFQSVGLTPDTSTRTSPGPGSGRSMSAPRSTSAAAPGPSYSAAFTPGLLPVDVAIPGGEGHGAMADDGGEATDDDLGDLAVFLAGSALQRAGAAHDHSLVDPQTVGAVRLR